MVPALKILLVIAANRDAAVNGCAMLLRFALHSVLLFDWSGTECLRLGPTTEKTSH